VMAAGRSQPDLGSRQEQCATLAAHAFDELIEIGALPSEHRDRAMLSVWAGLFGLATLCSEGMHGADDPAFRRAALDAVLRTTALGLGLDPKLLPPALPLPALRCPRA